MTDPVENCLDLASAVSRQSYVDANKGMAVRTLERIEAGACVIEVRKSRPLQARSQTVGDFRSPQYRGEIVDSKEALRREEEYDAKNQGCYMFYFPHEERNLW